MTDVKLSNMLFDHIAGDEYVEKVLTSEPLVIEGEYEAAGERYPLLGSQPFPSVITPETTPHLARVMNVDLVDLGQGIPSRETQDAKLTAYTAQRAGEQPTIDMFSAPSLRAPEILLHSSFSPALDIWAIGCVVRDSRRFLPVKMLMFVT
jgi:serine/threonine-protein kinase SRPK3